MTGELQGGWTYVWAAYIVVWAGLFLYGGALVRRYVSKSAMLPPVGDTGNGDENEER